MTWISLRTHLVNEIHWHYFFKLKCHCGLFYWCPCHHQSVCMTNNSHIIQQCHLAFHSIFGRIYCDQFGFVYNFWLPQNFQQSLVWAAVFPTTDIINQYSVRIFCLSKYLHQNCFASIRIYCPNILTWQ